MNRNTQLFFKRTSLVLSLCIAGCQGYGAKWVPVTLKTRPPEKQSRAFLVPLEDWEKIPEVATAVQPLTPHDPESLRRALEPYRITASRTPVRTNAMPYQMIYAVEYVGKYQWYKVKPEAGKPNEFEIALEP